VTSNPRPRSAAGAAGWQPGDRIALIFTSDPYTRLRPGDQGTVTRWDPAAGRLSVRWDSGSTLALLPADGDRVRLLAPAAGPDGPEPENPAAPARTAARTSPTPPPGCAGCCGSHRCAACILRVVDCT
jgi:hypothetical protein